MSLTNEDLTFYYVYKRGVYGHGVFGIFLNLEEAVQRANFAARMDKDSHHSWEVHEHKNNIPYETYGSNAAYTSEHLLLLPGILKYTTRKEKQCNQ